MAEGRGILGLPDALVGQICSQFCPHCAGEDCVGGLELPASFWGPEYFGTLVALTQVNVRIGRRAQLVRLHVFCGRRDSLPLLTRTIVECPAFAAHIFVVRLGDRDKDTDRGCILWDLATPQDFNTLKALVVPDLAANFDLLCAQGEQLLLAPFQQLPSIEDSFFSPPRTTDVFLGVRGNSLPEWMPGEVSTAVVRQPDQMIRRRVVLCPLPQLWTNACASGSHRQRSAQRLHHPQVGQEHQVRRHHQRVAACLVPRVEDQQDDAHPHQHH
jgi:hypothetical protein